jgi:hypothetical protein
MPASSNLPTPQTLEEFLFTLTGEESPRESTTYVALLSFAARQPGSANRLPTAWIKELDRKGLWYPQDMWLAAGIGERIRDAKFIALPEADGV